MRLTYKLKTRMEGLAKAFFPAPMSDHDIAVVDDGFYKVLSSMHPTPFQAGSAYLVTDALEANAGRSCFIFVYEVPNAKTGLVKKMVFGVEGSPCVWELNSYFGVRFRHGVIWYQLEFRKFDGNWAKVSERIIELTHKHKPTPFSGGLASDKMITYIMEGNMRSVPTQINTTSLGAYKLMI